MGTVEFCRLLDCRFVQYRKSCQFRARTTFSFVDQNTWMISSSMIVGGLSWWQSWIWCAYDSVFLSFGSQFEFLRQCLVRLLYRRILYLLDGSYRRCLSYRISRCCTVFLRDLGFLMACLQSRGNGLYLVRGAVLARR